MLVVIGILIAVVVGGVAGAAISGLYRTARLKAAQRTRQHLLQDAQREADAVRREAQIETREQAIKLRAEIETEVQERRGQVIKVEERLLAREEEIDAKLTELARREQGLSDREVHIRT